MGKTYEQATIYREETSKANQHEEMLKYSIIWKLQQQRRIMYHFDLLDHQKKKKKSTLDTDKCWWKCRILGSFI